MKRRMIAAIAVVLFAGHAFPVDANRSLVPTDPFLTDSVVYAEVASVAEVSPSAVRVTLNVKCTLMGPYDAAACPVLHAEMSLTPGRMIPGTRLPPKSNARVVVRLHYEAYPLSVPWYIPWNDVGYSRDGTAKGAAVVEVKGFDDPKVSQIIARLRELRKEAKGNQDTATGRLAAKAAAPPGAEDAAKMAAKIKEAAADLLRTVEHPQWLAPQRAPLIEFRREVLRGLESLAASESEGLDSRIAIHLLGVWRDTEASYLLAHKIASARGSPYPESRPLECYPAAQALVEIGSPALKVILDQRMPEPVTDQELRIFAWVIYLIDGRDLGLARLELKISELSRSYPRTRFENVSRLLEIYKTIDFKDQGQWPQPTHEAPTNAKPVAK